MVVNVVLLNTFVKSSQRMLRVSSYVNVIKEKGKFKSFIVVL